MLKNYARDFDDKTLNNILEEELYKNKIIRNKIRLMREDFWFYLITTVWIIGISFVPQYTVFIMLAAFYLCYKSEYFKEKYYYKISIMFMILGIYYVIWLIAKVFSIFSRVFYLTAVVPVLVSAIPFLAIMAGLICTLISGMRIVLNSNLPGMDSVCCFFGKYNLGRQKAESDDKICRLESEINIRKKRIAEEEFLKM